MSFRVLLAVADALLLAVALAGRDAIGGGSDATLSGQVVTAAPRSTSRSRSSKGPGGGEATAVPVQRQPSPGTTEPSVITQIKITASGPNGSAEGYRPRAQRPGRSVRGRAWS